MAPSWCEADNIAKGALAGEIYFGSNAFNAWCSGNGRADKLVKLLATYQYAEVHDFQKPKLLLLGDTAPTEAVNLRKSRADTVEQYLRGKLPANSMKNVRFEAAAKGAATLPGMKPPPGSGKSVVQIMNKGEAITPLAAPLKKAATLAEALQVALQVFQRNPPAHANPQTRIRYWLEGRGKASIERGDDDYLVPGDTCVTNLAQPASRPLSPEDFAALRRAAFPRIGEQLKQVAATGNPPAEISAMLITIDNQIMAGVDFLIKAKNMEASTYGSGGLDQLSRFVSHRGADPSSFYAAYGFGAVKQDSETDTAMGIWTVKAANKWTWRYELRLGGDAKWTDVNNGRTSTGRWVQESDRIRFDWKKENSNEMGENRGVLDAAPAHSGRTERHLGVGGWHDTPDCRCSRPEDILRLVRSRISRQSRTTRRGWALAYGGMKGANLAARTLPLPWAGGEVGLPETPFTRFDGNSGEGVLHATAARTPALDLDLVRADERAITVWPRARRSRRSGTADRRSRDRRRQKRPPPSRRPSRGSAGAGSCRSRHPGSS